MSDKSGNTQEERKPSILFSPQVIAAIIGAVVTILVAVLPSLLGNDDTPNPTQSPPVVIVTATLTDVSAAARAADTPMPSQAVIATEPTPVTADVLVVWDSATISLVNQTERVINVNDIVFRASDRTWAMNNLGGLAASFPAGTCIRIHDTNARDSAPPPECADAARLHAYIEIGSNDVFWNAPETFEIVRRDQVLATCVVAQETCAFAL